MSRRPVPSLPGDWKEQHRTARHAAKNVCREAAETISRLGTARITIPEEILAKWGNVPTGEDVSVFAKPETMTEAQKMSAPTLASAYDTFSALESISNQAQGRVRYTLLALLHLLSSMTIAPKKEWTQLLTPLEYLDEKQAQALLPQSPTNGGNQNDANRPTDRGASLSVAPTSLITTTATHDSHRLTVVPEGVEKGDHRGSSHDETALIEADNLAIPRAHLTRNSLPVRPVSLITTIPQSLPTISPSPSPSSSSSSSSPTPSILRTDPTSDATYADVVRVLAQRNVKLRRTAAEVSQQLIQLQQKIEASREHNRQLQQANRRRDMRCAIMDQAVGGLQLKYAAAQAALEKVHAELEAARTVSAGLKSKEAVHRRQTFRNAKDSVLQAISTTYDYKFAVNRGQALLAAKSAALETAKRDQRDLRVQAEILEQAVLTMRHVVGALITQATQKDAVAAAQLARKRAIEKEDIVQKTRTKAVIEITDTILKETTGGVSNLIGTGDGAMVSSPRSRRRSVIHGGNTESSSSMSMMTPRRGSTISGSTTSSGSSRSSSSQGTRAQLSFGSEPGTTSTSSPRPSVIKPPVESMFWVPHKQRIKEYVKAAISAALEAYEAKCREEDVEIERKQRASMFKGLGTSDKVPKFLHAVGPIRNLGFTSAHANLITKEVWALKSIRDHHLAKNGLPRTTLHQFFPIYLADRVSSPTERTEFAYSFLAAAQLSATDPDNDLFLRALRGELSDEQYHDQMAMLTHFKKLVLRLDVVDGQCDGILEKDLFFEGLRTFFPVKTEARMRALHQIVFDEMITYVMEVVESKEQLQHLEAVSFAEAQHAEAGNQATSSSSSSSSKHPHASTRGIVARNSLSSSSLALLPVATARSFAAGSVAMTPTNAQQGPGRKSINLNQRRSTLTASSLVPLTGARAAAAAGLRSPVALTRPLSLTSGAHKLAETPRGMDGYKEGPRENQSRSSSPRPAMGQGDSTPLSPSPQRQSLADGPRVPERGRLSPGPQERTLANRSPSPEPAGTKEGSGGVISPLLDTRMTKKLNLSVQLDEDEDDLIGPVREGSDKDRTSPVPNVHQPQPQPQHHSNRPRRMSQPGGGTDSHLLLGLVGPVDHAGAHMNSNRERQMSMTGGLTSSSMSSSNTRGRRGTLAEKQASMLGLLYAHEVSTPRRSSRSPRSESGWSRTSGGRDDYSYMFHQDRDSPRWAQGGKEQREQITREVMCVDIRPIMGEANGPRTLIEAIRRQYKDEVAEFPRKLRSALVAAAKSYRMTAEALADQEGNGQLSMFTFTHPQPSPLGSATSRSTGQTGPLSNLVWKGDPRRAKVPGARPLRIPTSKYLLPAGRLASVINSIDPLLTDDDIDRWVRAGLGVPLSAQAVPPEIPFFPPLLRNQPPSSPSADESTSPKTSSSTSSTTLTTASSSRDTVKPPNMGGKGGANSKMSMPSNSKPNGTDKPHPSSLSSSSSSSSSSQSTSASKPTSQQPQAPTKWVATDWLFHDKHELIDVDLFMASLKSRIFIHQTNHYVPDVDIDLVRATVLTRKANPHQNLFTSLL